MYLPEKFKETRPALLHGLIQAHPLGMIVTAGADGLAANHIPFEFVADDDAPHGLLQAHVARRNDVWRRDGAEALVVFQGPSAYITPSLYDEKALSGRVVPTYHYAVVHVHGRLRAVEDPDWIMRLLARQTSGNETGRPAPWAVHDAPPDYIDRLRKAIVGIEIRIERIEGKWKLGQDGSDADQARIEAAMEGPMAELMRERRFRVG